MKAILKHSLRRRPKPTNTIKGNGFLPEGSVIDVDKIVDGVAIDKISTWYLAKDGFYYWGGAVEKLNDVPDLLNPDIREILFPPVRINWKNNFIGLAPELMAFTGKGVRVAIIDSGVDLSHPDIVDNISDAKDFTQDKVPMVDKEGHGSAIAGIIGGNAKNANGIIGVAPDCEIIPIKVLQNTHDNVGLSKNIASGLRHAIDVKADIVNISYDLSGAVSSLLTSTILEAAEKGIILIASAGDANELTELGVTYPGSDPHFIAIGSTNLFNLQNIINKRPAHLNYLSGYKKIWTISPKPQGYETVQGSSFSAAFLSGLSALILSRIKANSTSKGGVSKADLIKEVLHSASDSAQLFQENHFSFITIST